MSSQRVRIGYACLPRFRASCLIPRKRWGFPLSGRSRARLRPRGRAGRIRHVLFVLSAVLPLAVPAHAQDSATESRETDVRQDIETRRDVERTQEEALDIEALVGGSPVTFQQVLKDPDNIELNVRYALTQIQQGNVRGAGATLERVLLIRPDLAAVRVLFAIVLFRLDNLDEAERELKALSELDLAPDLRQQIDRYLDQIAARRKRTQWVLSVNFSLQYDWNRNAAPASEARLAADLPTIVTGGSGRQDDISYNGLTQLTFEHDLGAQAQHKMIGGLVFYQGEQVQQDDLDLQAITADWGYELDFAPASVTPRLLYENIKLARSKYLDAHGIKVDADYDLSNTWTLFGTAQAKHQSYRSIESSASANLRSGREYKLVFGTSHILTPRQRLRFSFEDTRNVAARSFNSYDRNRIVATHTLLFGGGDFLLSSLAATYDRYDHGDPAVSAQTRHDWVGRARVTYGIPWNTLFTDAPEFWKDFTLTVSGEMFRQISSITNYTYNNYRFSAGISRRWEF